MSQQERRAKAEKQAAQQAAAIIEEATSKIVAGRRSRVLSDEHKALAPKVKEYRDQGVAWWLIGFKLSLPGSADNVAQGKSGASFARRIYADAYGAIPKTVRSRSAGEKNEDVKAIKRERKTDRVAKVKAGEAVLRLDMTDEEVVETLRGRVIGWTTDLTPLWPEERREDNDAPKHAEQEAGVHKRWAKVEEHGGERCLVFKSFDPNAPIKYRAFAGATRIVRLRTIHTVR